ncbi:hypothetical protein PMAYCL1PPCAC_10682, partial [Pristionchus mayeri]
AAQFLVREARIRRSTAERARKLTIGEEPDRPSELPKSATTTDLPNAAAAAAARSPPVAAGSAPQTTLVPTVSSPALDNARFLMSPAPGGATITPAHASLTIKVLKMTINLSKAECFS